MNIDITSNEYRDLLDILHIADVVMSGHRRDEDRRSERHQALIQKLYSLAQGEGLGQLIAHNMPAKRYAPTAEFEKNSIAHAIIDEFGDHLFWDGLISRLTARDATQKAGGTEHLSAMSSHDRQAMEGVIRRRYIEEFSRNGISNVAVFERFITSVGLPVITSD